MFESRKLVSVNQEQKKKPPLIKHESATKGDNVSMFVQKRDGSLEPVDIIRITKKKFINTVFLTLTEANLRR